jgi:hypothetical protein
MSRISAISRFDFAAASHRSTVCSRSVNEPTERRAVESQSFINSRSSTMVSRACGRCQCTNKQVFSRRAKRTLRLCDCASAANQRHIFRGNLLARSDLGKNCFSHPRAAGCAHFTAHSGVATTCACRASCTACLMGEIWGTRKSTFEHSFRGFVDKILRYFSRCQSS